MVRMASVALIVCIIGAGVVAGKAKAGEGELAYSIFIRVNGRPITQESVGQVARYLLKREYNGKVPNDMQELSNVEKAAIRDLVRTQLIHSEAQRLNIRLDRDLTKRAIAMSGLRPDEVTPTIRRVLEADDLFEQIMMGEGTPIRSPSPKEIKQFYIDNRESFRSDAFIIVREIFIGEDGIKPQSFFKEQAEELIRQLEMVPVSQRTDAFDKMAREKSQDVFAEYGGRLTAGAEQGWMPQEFINERPDGRDIFPPEMVEGIRRLKQKGEVRLAISVDGMHILYLEDIKGGTIMPWAEASRIIEFHLKQRQKIIAMRNWINSIYDRSDVRWNDGTAYEKRELAEVLLPSERGVPQQ